MIKKLSRLPRAAGLFRVRPKREGGYTTPLNDKSFPDIETFEANYARQILPRAANKDAARRNKDMAA